MLLLLFGASSGDAIAVAIAETGDSISLRVMSGTAPAIDPNFRVLALPRCRTIVPKSS
ncbi:MAG TPA: hypothetical protein VNH44_08715 [Micropepsaceae bacterium]|nr:hypothetical protein [Micropepsaceae bacterium]